MLFDCRTIAAGLFAALCLAANPVQSQTPDTSIEKPPEWLIGMSLGVPGVQHNVFPALFTAGLQFTQVRGGRIGPDLAIGTMPFLIANKVIPVGFRGDVTVPL